MAILGCLDSPTGGTYALDGERVERLSGSRARARSATRRSASSSSSTTCCRKASVLRNVELPMLYAGVPRKERRRARHSSCSRRSASPRRRSELPATLSGGQRQRVAIARALANRPALLLADEPTGALDSKTGHEVLELFRELHPQGNTILLVTHDLGDRRRSPSASVEIRDGLHR